MDKEYIRVLEDNEISFKLDEPLSKYCTYKTGGPAKIMVFPKDEKEMNIAMNCQMKTEIIGFGSNILCSDYGFDGVIVNTKDFNKISIMGSTIKASCGAKLQEVREIAQLNALGGLEFTFGIPATCGGAICQNAGCFSKCVGDYVAYVTTNKAVYNNENCQFSYRNSIFSSLKNEAIINIGFILKPGESDIIEEKTEKFKKLRKNSQPHGKSCGSVFINDGYFAGKIIDMANLKGYSIGGAKISEKHANFILNSGNNSQDIFDLIQFVKNKVFKCQNIKLKEELKYIGDFNLQT